MSKIDDKLVQTALLLQDVWTDLDLAEDVMISMELRHLRTSIDILRKIGNRIEGRNPCHKTARAIEHVIVKVNAELRALLLQKSLGDYKIVCPKCFRPNFFENSHKGPKECEHCEMSLI